MAKAKKKAENPEAELSRIDKIVQAFDKISHTSGEIQVMGAGEVIQDIPVIPSGIPSLDKALGVGGYPQGRIGEVIGPAGAGKTSITLHAIASAQKHGGICAFVDAEHALDIKYAQNLGIDVEKLMVIQPDCGEAALSAVEYLAGLLGPGDLIVVDSVAALTPRAEIDGDMGATHMGLQARLMSQAMRKLTGIVAKGGVVLLFINQIRNRMVTYGSPEVGSGGMALKYYSSIRLDIRSTGKIKNKEEIIGNKTKIKVVKNKVAPPFREVEVELIFGEGVSYINNVVKTALDAGLIVQKGAWVYLVKDESSLGQGMPRAVQHVKDTPELLEYLETELSK